MPWKAKAMRFESRLILIREIRCFTTLAIIICIIIKYILLELESAFVMYYMLIRNHTRIVECYCCDR